jgi:hypothetical protein
MRLPDEVGTCQGRHNGPTCGELGTCGRILGGGDCVRGFRVNFGSYVTVVFRRLHRALDGN